MKTNKNHIFVGLTLLAIILGAMLPTILAKVEDVFADEKVNYVKQKNVSLIRELSDVEKMYLLKEGTPVSISEERTNLSWTNMLEVLSAALSWYHSNGFIYGAPKEFTIVKCEPRLYYSNEMSNLSGIFWRIDMELVDYYNQSISLCLDDQTGKVLLISYECEEPLFDQKDLNVPLMNLYECYQSERSWNNLMYSSNDNVEKVKEKTKVEFIFSYGDVIYGENAIVFTMTETGFSIHLEDYNTYTNNLMQQ